MRNANRWMWGFVALGVGLRLVHFLREPAVWHDEAALIINVLGKTFAEMLGPLFHAEAAPPLFLMAERAVVQLVGDDGPTTLRLLPFLASCLSVVLFAVLARRIIPPASAAWAVLLFACSDRLLWHCCEAKPYAIDTCVGVITALLFVHATTGRFALWTLVLAACAVPFLWLVFPACFLFGGVLVGLLPKLWKEGSRLDWAAYVTLVLAVGVGFLALYFGPIRAQRCDAMDQCWIRLFPDWSRPWFVPIWSAGATLEVVRYVLQPTGNFLVGVLAFGAAALWRRGQRDLVVMLLLPLALVFLAACLQKYPFGCARIIVFGAPAMILLIGAGIEPSRLWMAKYTRFSGVVMVVLLLIPVLQGVRRTAVPWFREDTDAAAEYVLDHYQPGEGLAFNKWEYEYYFRNLPAPPFYCGWGAMPDAPRVWLVVSAGLEVDRSHLVAELAAGWTQIDRRDFRSSTAVLLERPRQPGGS